MLWTLWSGVPQPDCFLSHYKSNPSIILPAGYFFTGDGAYRSKEGYYQITGRLDDVINVSGHRIGTAEIEDVVVGKVNNQPNLAL